MTPLVSVVMAVNRFNEHLPDAIHSILDQTFINFEFIIVANNCDDRLYDHLRSYTDNRIKLHRTQIGQLSFNLNYAINLATTDLIIRMDADDVSLPDRIAEQYAFLIQNPEISVLGTSYEMINSRSELLKVVNAIRDHYSIISNIYYKNPICHPSTMFRKSKVLIVGGYLGGSMTEDYGLWLRLARKGEVKFANLPKILLKYRVHDAQSRGHRISYSEAAGLVFTEFLIKPSFVKLLGSIISAFKIGKAK